MKVMQKAMALIKEGNILMDNAKKMRADEKKEVWDRFNEHLKKLKEVQNLIQDEIRYFVDGGPGSTESNRVEINGLRRAGSQITSEFEKFYTFIEKNGFRFR